MILQNNIIFNLSDSMIYIFFILILFSHQTDCSAARKTRVVQQKITFLDQHSARITIDSKNNTAILYHKRYGIPQGFYLMINNQKTPFITYEKSADKETNQTLVDIIPVQTDLRSLIAFKLNSQKTNYATCKSYAIFNPLDFSADSSSENNTHIHIFHFIKGKINNPGFVIFGENPKIIPPNIDVILLNTCLSSLDFVTAQVIQNSSKNIFDNNDISDDASTIYDDSSSSFNEIEEIPDESEF